MRDWKPGDVAITAKNTIALCHNGGKMIDQAGAPWSDRKFAGNLRRLVVIDPENREQVERLIRLQDKHFNDGDVRRSVNSDDLRDMQAALREFANPKSPRINEPSSWGVVEASCTHGDERRQWVRFPDGQWYGRYGDGSAIGAPDDWASLIDPVLIREGVHDA